MRKIPFWQRALVWGGFAVSILLFPPEVVLAAVLLTWTITNWQTLRQLKRLQWDAQQRKFSEVYPAYATIR